MKRGWLAVALLLVLAGCSTASPVSTSSTPEGSSTPGVTSTPEPTETTAAAATPGPVDPNDYLVDGALDVDPDGDGYWNAYYAWYLDETQSTACFLAIFSGDTPSVDCFVVPGFEAQVTYPMPAGVQVPCDYTTENPYDGYGLDLGGKPVMEGAGFSGCQEYRAFDPAMAPLVKVMTNGGILTVRDFTCETLDGVATCTRDGQTASITFGLSIASFTT